MATSTSFKQECPSCEALVPIKDASLVGRKIDCPKCKFRFMVEAPAAPVEEAEEETKPAKNAKANTEKVTTAKPTNGKAAGAKAANGKAAEKETPAAKNGKPASKKSKAAAADEDSPKKKKKQKEGGSSRILILGGILGVVAVLGLIVGGVLLWTMSGNKKGGTTPPTAGDPPSTSGGSGVKPGGPNDPPKPGDPPKDATPPVAPTVADISNLLPNETEQVVVFNIPELVSSSFKRAAFMTAGAFPDDGFQTSFGFPLTDVQRVILAFQPSQNGVFSVLRTTKPIARDKLIAALKLDNQQQPVNGITPYRVKAHLDSLSNFLVKGEQPNDEFYLHIPDDYTLVFANKVVMDQFLNAGAKPTFLTQPPSPSDPPANKPPAGPGQQNPPPGMKPGGNPMPMPPGPMKGAALENPRDLAAASDNDAVEVYVKEPDGQFVAYQQPGRERPMSGTGGQNPMPGKNPMPGTNPMPMPGTNPMPGVNPMPGPQPPPPPAAGSMSYMTVRPELKRVLDKADPNQKALVVVATYGHTRLGLAEEIGRRLLDAIPRTGSPNNPGGGFGGPEDSEKVLKSKVEPFRDVQVMAVSVTTLYETKLVATAALEGLNPQSTNEIEATVRFFGHILPAYFSGMFTLDVSGIPDDSMPPPPGGPNAPMPPRGGPNPGNGNLPPPPPKGRDGALTLAKIDGILILGLELTLNEKAYQSTIYKLSELCVQLKSHGELVDARSHVHELAAALREYAKEKNAFPRGTIDRPLGDRKVPYPPTLRLSWLADKDLLKHLGHGIYSQKDGSCSIPFDLTKSWREGGNFLIAQMIVPEYLARTRADEPGEVRYPGVATPLAGTYFVGMAGVGFDAASYRADDPAVAKKIGVFGYDRVTKLSDLHFPDKTIAVIQLKAKHATPWIAGGGSTVRGVSDDPSDAPGAAVEPFVSVQPDGKEGAVAIMADGKVRFIPKSISNEVFRGLCAIDGDKPAGDLDSIAPVIPPPNDAILNAVPAPADPKPAPNPPPVSEASKIDWKEVASKEGGFTALMPSSVQSETTQQKGPLGPVNETKYLAMLVDTKQLFVVVVTDLPAAAAVAGPEAIYKTALAEIMKLNKATKIANEKKISQGAISGMEYRLEAGPGEKAPGEFPKMVVRMYLAPNRLYVVLAGNAEGSRLEADALKFLDSFKITGGAPAPAPKPRQGASARPAETVTPENSAVVFVSASLNDPKPEVKPDLKPEPVKLPEGWKEYVSKTGNFTIGLPEGKPTEKTETTKTPGGDIKTTTVILTDDKTKAGFVMIHFDLPPVISAVGETFLNEAMKKAAEKKGAVKTKIMLAGSHPGVEVRVPGEGKKVMVQRAYLVNDRMYLLSVGNVEPGESVTAFLDSFHLTTPVTAVGAMAWKEVASKEGGFSVLLPPVTLPLSKKKEKEPFGEIETTTHTGVGAGTKTFYFVTYSDLPPEVLAKGADSIYTTMRDYVVKGSKDAKITGEQKVKTGGVPGVEFTVSVPAEKTKPATDTTFRVFLSKKRLYMLITFSPEGKVSAEDTKKFFESLKLSEPTPAKESTKQPG